MLDKMLSDLETIKEEAKKMLEQDINLEILENLRIRFLGKKGDLTAVLRAMGSLTADERPKAGAIANQVRQSIEEALETKKSELSKVAMTHKLKSQVIDVTMPGKADKIAKLHPLTQVQDEIKDIFIGMGFSIAEGPDIDLDYYNFEALNVPKNHPARDTQDTFYIDENVVLRSQTSTVQIHVMEKQSPPIRIIAPGRVYRSDAVDATHSPVFHQIEGLVVDKGMTMADLKGTLDAFVKTLYGDDTKTRFRPHHFPFTEPSAEMDISCFACGGKGCRSCKGEGWIEILGCGMVHPKVLERVNIDPNVYSGFAFGMGLERVAMKKFDIDDIRLFFENDIRFLEQF